MNINDFNGSWEGYNGNLVFVSGGVTYSKIIRDNETAGWIIGFSGGFNASYYRWGFDYFIH